MKTIIPSTKISISENNVLAVIGDQKLPVLQSGVVVSFEAQVISSQDYSPFGVTLSGRSWGAGYRYGFNNSNENKKKSNSEIKSKAIVKFGVQAGQEIIKKNSLNALVSSKDSIKEKRKKEKNIYFPIF